jgi:hypothetical protein
MKRYNIEAETSTGDHPFAVLDISENPDGEWVRYSDIHKVYYFEYWGSDRVLKEATVYATCEEHAVLKFEKEYPDCGYNEPYIWPPE